MKTIKIHGPNNSIYYGSFANFGGCDSELWLELDEDFQPDDKFGPFTNICVNFENGEIVCPKENWIFSISNLDIPKLNEMALLESEF